MQKMLCDLGAKGCLSLREITREASGVEGLGIDCFSKSPQGYLLDKCFLNPVIHCLPYLIF